ncbi:MAG: pilus assembly protein [Acidobacteriales bacterium]|nr:pilus assembly protein [Terriglobales bacterium]
MLKIVRKLVRAEGAEIAEAALVLPVVFTFLLGIVWFGRAFNIYATITQAAQQGAVTAARPACATCPQGCPWQDGGGTDTHFPCDATVENSVFSVMDASSVDKSKIITYMPSVAACPSPPAPPGGGCTTTNNVTICRLVVLNPTSPPAQCGTIVSFQYPFQFHVPFTSLGTQPIFLKAEARSRMEN